MTPLPDLDVLVCAGRRDVGGLLTTSLRLLRQHLVPATTVTVVTPDPQRAWQRIHDDLGRQFATSVNVRADDEVCPEAEGMPAWFRQQFIKLHADRVTRGRHVACVSADTVILRPIRATDLFDQAGRPLLRYFRHEPPNPHLPFERGRVLNVARLLDTNPCRSLPLGDFICDLFVFDVELLRALRAHLTAINGDLTTMLRRFGTRQGSDDRFGEWTAYAVFLLDVLDPSPEAAGFALYAGGARWFRQVHERSGMLRPDRYDASVVHFVWQPADPTTVIDDLAAKKQLPWRPG